jgi:hypothetical protein
MIDSLETRMWTFARDRARLVPSSGDRVVSGPNDPMRSSAHRLDPEARIANRSRWASASHPLLSATGFTDRATGCSAGVQDRCVRLASRIVGEIHARTRRR